MHVLCTVYCVSCQYYSANHIIQHLTFHWIDILHFQLVCFVGPWNNMTNGILKGADPSWHFKLKREKKSLLYIQSEFLVFNTIRFITVSMPCILCSITRDSNDQLDIKLCKWPIMLDRKYKAGWISDFVICMLRTEVSLQKKMCSFLLPINAKRYKSEV